MNQGQNGDEHCKQKSLPLPNWRINYGIISMLNNYYIIFIIEKQRNIMLINATEMFHVSAFSLIKWE